MQTSDDQSGKVADGRVGHGRVDVSALNSDSDNTFRIFKRKTCDVTSNLVCRPSLSVYNGRWAGERKKDGTYIRVGMVRFPMLRGSKMGIPRAGMPSSKAAKKLLITKRM